MPYHLATPPFAVDPDGVEPSQNRCKPCLRRTGPGPLQVKRMAQDWLDMWEKLAFISCDYAQKQGEAQGARDAVERFLGINRKEE